MTRFRFFLRLVGVAVMLAWPLATMAGAAEPETRSTVPGLSADGRAATFDSFFKEGSLVIRGGQETVATISYRALPRPCPLNAMCAPPAAPDAVFVDLPRHRVFVSRCPTEASNCTADALFEVRLPGLEARKVGVIAGAGADRATLAPSGKQLALIDGWHESATWLAPSLFVVDLAAGTVRKRELSAGAKSDRCDEHAEACPPKVTGLSWVDEGTVAVTLERAGKPKRTERIEVSSMKPATK